MLEEPVEVLVVDDREENLLALEIAIGSSEYKLVKTTSGDGALRYLLENQPALILLDVQMPGLDGYETAAIIKRSERTCDIPIIFLTALSPDDHFVAKGYERGAVDYINKPFDAGILRSKVKVFADLHRKSQRLLMLEKEQHQKDCQERERRLSSLEIRSLRRDQIQQKRYHDLVQGINHGIVWSAQADTFVFSYVGPTAERLLGYPKSQWMSELNFWMNHIYPCDAAKFCEARKKAVETGQPVDLVHRYVASDGKIVWLQTGMRSSDAEKSGQELQGLSVDITRLKETEESLQKSKDRSDFLANASLILANSLEFESSLRKVSRQLVPCFATWFSVDSVGATGFQMQHLECGEESEKLTEAFNTEPPQLYTENALARVFESGKPLVANNGVAEAVVGFQGARLEAMKNLRSLVMVPITIRGLSLGVLTIGSSGDRIFEEQDVQLASSLATRIAAAMDVSRLYGEAQAAIKLRDEFLSIASHELKTPLTPLKLQIQQVLMLLESQEPKKQMLTDLLGTSDKHINRLTRLIEDLLDISRLDNGRLSLERHHFDFEEAIRDILQRFAGQLQESRCPLRMDIDPRVFVNWDLFRMEQVIVNLLTNAMKFGRGKPIHIRLKKENSVVRFSIRDEGIGIDVIDQSRIFNRFERAVSSFNFGGMGLGLYISKQIVELHHGSIRVESELNRGSEFIVEIPDRLETSRRIDPVHATI